MGLLLKLAEPVDFDAVDGRPVDLVFVLLVPEQNPEQHLKTLSHLANLFNDDDYRDDLRHARAATICIRRRWSRRRKSVWHPDLTTGSL